MPLWRAGTQLGKLTYLRSTLLVGPPLLSSRQEVLTGPSKEIQEEDEAEDWGEYEEGGEEDVFGWAREVDDSDDWGKCLTSRRPRRCGRGQPRKQSQVRREEAEVLQGCHLLRPSQGWRQCSRGRLRQTCKRQKRCIK